ncbi:hypothetical protein [Streptomyces sp. P17]|uniref:hypothetical protein n=1 Tax=Streptomyces sp. P17 TaxID=3074716 RepID=UPI0028F45549|nr:hypothetical protein [Streptomyces sp. P17]MDT9699284.1 hypothetical protein [Streptomyces sp. P17]
MGYSLEELRSWSDDEVVRRHDEVAANTSPGTSFYLAELDRRALMASARASDALARKSYNLTIANTVLAVVAVILALIALFK